MSQPTTHNQIRQRYLTIADNQNTRFLLAAYEEEFDCMCEVEEFLFDHDPHNRESKHYANVVGVPPWMLKVAMNYVKELGLIEQDPNTLLKAIL